MKDRTRYRAFLTLLHLLMVFGLIEMPSAGWGKSQTHSQKLISPKQQHELTTYIDSSFDWSIQYPSDWSIATEFENVLDSDDQVIKKRVGLYGEQRATIWIDIYINRTGMSLETWFDTYKQPLLSSKPEQTIRIKGVLNGNPAVLAVDDKDKTAVRQVTLVSFHQNLAVAITYLVLDGGLARDKFHSLLTTFRWADSTIQSAQQQLTTISKLDEILLSAQPAAANCCGINSPGNICICCTRDSDGKEVGNCVWWACHTRRDVGCAGNANTWATCARQRGKTVNTTPAAGSLVTWNTENHIAYVESVNNDGSINISEMNCYSSRACGGTTGYDGVNRRTVSASGKSFIHGDSPPQCNDSRNPEGGFTSPNNNQQITDRVDLKGWARDDCNVDYVEFTATWPGKSWHVLQRVDADCGGGQSCNYDFNWNLSGVPDGWITLGYDVYDKTGKKVLSPNGTRQIRKIGRCAGPNLQSPEKGFRTKNTTITFRWQDINCEHSGFKIRVKTNPDMNSGGEIVAERDLNGTETTISFDSGRINQALYWSVQANNAPGGVEWSTAREFKIYDDPPNIFFNTANGNNSDTINSRDQTWSFTGSASDPENHLDRVEFRCSGDGCGSGPDRTGGGNWSITRSGMSGKNDIYFRACDEKQCTDSRHLDLNIDLSPPSTNAGIEGEKEGEWYHSAVNVRLHADDGSTGRARAGVKEIRYRIDGGGWQTQNGGNATIAISNDGNHSVEYYAVDQLGNEESVHSVSFKIDATPPTAVSGISESNGAPNDQWQKAKNVPAFTWAASSDNLSGLWGYQFYFGDNLNGEGYQSFTADQPRQWTPLPAGVRTGTYYLRGRTRDNAGSYSSWATLFTYRYDGTAPENPETATHAAGAINDTWQRTTSQPNFTWPVPHDEGSGIKGYSVYWGSDPNGETADFSANAGFQSATPLCAANAACTGYLRVRSLDNVDNPADKWSSVFTLRYDGAPPVAAFTINGGVTQTNQTQIVLNLTASDQGSGLHAMRFSNDGVNWTGWEAYANERIWQIPAIGRQSWPVYVQVQDNVGLESAVVSHTTFFEVNRAQPRSEGFRLFDYTASAGSGTHASASFQGRSTVGQVVDAARSSSDNYRISGGYEAGSQAIPLIVPGHDTFLFINGVFASGVVANTMQSGSFQMIGTLGEVALPNNVTTLSSNNFRHQPGFLAAAPSGQPLPAPTIIPEPGPTPIPTPAPDCEFPQVSINNGAVFTNNPNVMINLCAPRAVQMIVSNDGGFGGVQWEPYGRSKAWTLTTLGQYVLPRYIYVAFKDAAGTIYSTYLDDIIYDPNPPSGTLAVGDSISTDLLLQSAVGASVQAASADMFEVGGVTFLRQVGSLALAAPLALRSLNAEGTVDLFFNAQDDNSGIREMQVSTDTGFSGATWENYSALRPWIPTDGDGVKTLYARFRDSAGNISAATNASFALDTQPPLGGIGIVDSIIGLNTVTVTLYLQAEDNLSGVADMRISNDPTFVNALWQPFAGNVVWSVYPDAQQNTGVFYVQFRDLAGNVSQSYSTEYLLDTQPPIVYVEVDPGETLNRSVRVYAYDELSALDTLALSNDPLLIEGVITQPYTDTVAWTFDDRRVVWVQTTDSVGNRSEPYPAYAALTNEVIPPTDLRIFLPIIKR